MHSHRPPSLFWTNWLFAASLGVMLFGLVLVLAPQLASQGFALLIYADPARIAAFGPEAASYIGLVHAVLGAVMFGWGLALAYVVKTMFAAGQPAGWNLVALSIAAWFIPDTSYSLLAGYWQNAVLNVAFLLLFASPLVASRGAFRARPLAA